MQSPEGAKESIGTRIISVAPLGLWTGADWLLALTGPEPILAGPSVVNSETSGYFAL